MSDDLISRQAAIDAVAEGLKNIFVENRDIAEKMIGKLPSVPPERKRGKWIEANNHTYGIYECTACKAWTYIPNEPRDYNFCPRCGADMRGEQDGKCT